MRYNVFGKNSAGSAVSDLLVEIYRQKLVFSIAANPICAPVGGEFCMEYTAKYSKS